MYPAMIPELQQYRAQKRRRQQARERLGGFVFCGILVLALGATVLLHVL